MSISSNHKEKANQNHNEISCHSSRNCYHQTKISTQKKQKDCLRERWQMSKKHCLLGITGMVHILSHRDQDSIQKAMFRGSQPTQTIPQCGVRMCVCGGESGAPCLAWFGIFFLYWVFLFACFELCFCFCFWCWCWCCCLSLKALFFSVNKRTLIGWGGKERSP